MKYTAKKIDQNRYAVSTGKNYFTDTVTHSKRKAEIEALQMSAQWYQAQMDTAHAELIKLDAIDESDPRGYLA